MVGTVEPSRFDEAAKLRRLSAVERSNLRPNFLALFTSTTREKCQKATIMVQFWPKMQRHDYTSKPFILRVLPDFRGLTAS